MRRRSGGIRQANSDTIARQTRHGSDMKTLVPARTAAAPSYELETSRGALLLERGMSQCDASWPATTMSQMSHFPDTKMPF